MIDWQNDPAWLHRTLNEVKEYHPGEGRLALDIGMNLGAWSLQNARKFERIYAFEPSYGSYHIATALLRSFGITNVMPYNLAVWHEAGRVLDLYQHPKHTQSGNARLTNIPSIEKWENTPREPCFTITYNDVLALAGTQEVDYLKLDVESAEWNVLKGAYLDKTNIICLEIHPGFGKTKTREIESWLSKDHRQIGTAGAVQTWEHR
jgi:FkbM family methyltransferase